MPSGEFLCAEAGGFRGFIRAIAQLSEYWLNIAILPKNIK